MMTIEAHMYYVQCNCLRCRNGQKKEAGLPGAYKSQM